MTSIGSSGESMTSCETISLKYCEYLKEEKSLKLSSKYTIDVYQKRFPKAIFLKSHLTGKVIIFKPIGENHPKFDQDQWDGEQMVYEPMEPVPNLEILYVWDF
jgi:hypothetical protein